MDFKFPRKPPSRDQADFEKPVSWLVGRDLLAGLKWIVLFTVFKGKLDPRDWMTANVFPRFRRPEQCLSFWRQRNHEYWDRKVANDEFWAGYEPEGRPPHTPGSKFWQDHEGTPQEEFWFDYIADSGDGQLAVYNVACLCLSDLWASAAPGTDPTNSEVSFEHSAAHPTLLPRGQFLFVGGDTAYHIADYTSLSERFQIPFRWAFESLRGRRGGHKVGGRQGESEARDAEPRCPLFGVPGNHDYYDFTHGFNRQFRRPARLRNKLIGRLPPPPLEVPGFERVQDASYVAVRLPFGWWFWGLDTEVSKLDVRQQVFFGNLNHGRIPDKLIVATPEPSTVFRRQEAADHRTVQAFGQLCLPLPAGNKPGAAAQPKDPAWNVDPRTPVPGKCRLDLSGDVHHYARYYGPRAKDGLAAHLASEHYASVVAGGGGAFHHPSETHISGPAAVEEQVLYPTAAASRALVAGRLFDLYNIWKGGYVWLFGMIIAGLIYFAATVPYTSKHAVGWLLYDEHARQPRRLLWLWPIPYVPGSDVGSFSNPGYAQVAPVRLAAATLLFIGALVLLAVAVGLFGQIIKRIAEVPAIDAGATGKGLPTKYRDLWPVGACLLGALLLYAAGLATCLAGVSVAAFHPFACSLLVLYHILLAIGLVALGVQNSGWLAHRPKYDTGHKWRFVPVWVLDGLALCAAFFGIWFFGRYPAAYVLSDGLFALFVLGLFAALIGVGFGVAGALQNTAGKCLLALVGAWHAVLQLVVPLALVRLGDWRAVLLALLAVLVFSGLPVLRRLWPGIGTLLMKWPAPAVRVPLLGQRVSLSYLALLLAWFLYGVLLLGLPFMFHWRRAVYVVLDGQGIQHPYTSFLPQGWVDYLAQIFTASTRSPYAPAWALIVIALAAAVALGYVLSMSTLSWYFAVAFGFQGHNNEVGGAARIEQFKHIVRVRLTEQDLTAYVIAVDEPQREAAQMRPRLVDVFRLRVS